MQKQFAFSEVLYKWSHTACALVWFFTQRNYFETYPCCVYQLIPFCCQAARWNHCGYAIICLFIHLLMFGLFPILSQYDHSRMCVCVHVHTCLCVDVSFHLFQVNRNGIGDRCCIFNILTNCILQNVFVLFHLPICSV